MNKVQIIIDDDEDGKQMLEIGEDNGQLSPEEES